MPRVLPSLVLPCAWALNSSSACDQVRTSYDCKDQDLTGGTHNDVVELETCCALCNDDSRCKAWTWYESRRVCYLKSGCSNEVINDGVSGGAAMPPAPSPAPAPTPSPTPPSCSTAARSGLDCKDEDLSDGTHVGVTDASTCCALCDAESRCNAWTWYEASSVCYLKSGCSTPYGNDGVSGGAAMPPAPAPTPLPPAPPAPQRTTVSIDGERWLVNGKVVFPGSQAEGRLTNSRMINGIFDDSNPATRAQWAYPDTGAWDAERNTGEFVGNMSAWRAAGLMSFTVGLMGGSPHCYGNDGWVVSAFDGAGNLKPDWMRRLSLILQEADERGMVPIIQYFYDAQYHVVGDANREAAIKSATTWIAKAGYRNVIIDVFNEKCTSDWAPMVELVRSVSSNLGNQLLVGTSCLGSQQPSVEVVAASDFLLPHGNGCSPAKVASLLSSIRGTSTFKANPKPIVFNEDDHGNFADGEDSNFQRSLDNGAAWGFLCCCSGAVQGDYSTGYQCPPVDWRLGGPGECLSGPQGVGTTHGSKAEFAAMLARVTKPMVSMV